MLNCPPDIKLDDVSDTKSSRCSEEAFHSGPTPATSRNTSTSTNHNKPLITKQQTSTSPLGPHLLHIYHKISNVNLHVVRILLRRGNGELTNSEGRLVWRRATARRCLCQLGRRGVLPHLHLVL
jgi:hypothetical protein